MDAIVIPSLIAGTITITFALSCAKVRVFIVFTGMHLLVCSCGFAAPFHCACNIAMTSCDATDSDDDGGNDPRSINWSFLSLHDLRNMIIVSKIKYDGLLFVLRGQVNMVGGLGFGAKQSL
jgi:hypothetical protein